MSEGTGPALTLPEARIAGLESGAVLPAGLLRAGQRVVLRVLEAVGPGEYLISVGRQRVLARTGLSLETGGTYPAEVALRKGEVLLLLRPLGQNLLESLFPDRRLFLQAMPALLRRWVPQGSGPAGFIAGCLSPEGVKAALAACGMFYESRLKQALRDRTLFAVDRDFKGFLLRQLTGPAAANPRGLLSATLKNLEFQQLTASQHGPDGPVFFWLPFEADTFVEGFARRVAAPAEAAGFLMVFRVPFLEHEEVLISLLWNPGRLDVHFSASARVGGLLRPEVAGLAERLRDAGFSRLTVQVSEKVPAHLREALGGVRFTESYV